MLTELTMLSLIKTAAMLLLTATLMAGCGVRGSLEAPQAAKASGTATSPEDADPGEGSAAGPKPHRGFILDGLLR